MATLVLDIETIGRVREDEKAALSPLTGEIFSLAVFDVERALGTVYVTTDIPVKEVEGFVIKVCDERTLLEDFWLGAQSYDVFVTWNGWPFVWPFLYHRAVLNNVRLEVEISRQRSIEKQKPPYQVDLMRELSFGGECRSFSLPAWADFYGVEYSSSLKGDQVGEFFLQKKFPEIVAHNVADTLAIAGLYDKWLASLAPRSFLNRLEW